jgi:hypothetical protein
VPVHGLGKVGKHSCERLPVVVRCSVHRRDDRHRRLSCRPRSLARHFILQKYILTFADYSRCAAGFILDLGFDDESP